jgi:hypothetical protein
MRCNAERGLPSAYWIVLTSGLWLALLPLLLRKYSLPALLQSTANHRDGRIRRVSPDLDTTVQALVRLCRLRSFRTALFPRDCLRQSLVLFRALTRMGYAAVIHFGVRKRDGVFEGHSWVTLEDKLLGERGPVERFTRVYSYPDGQIPFNG